MPTERPLHNPQRELILGFHKMTFLYAFKRLSGALRMENVGLTEFFQRKNVETWNIECEHVGRAGDAKLCQPFDI